MSNFSISFSMNICFHLIINSKNRNSDFPWLQFWRKVALQNSTPMKTLLYKKTYSSFWSQKLSSFHLKLSKLAKQLCLTIENVHINLKQWNFHFMLIFLTTLMTSFRSWNHQGVTTPNSSLWSSWFFKKSRWLRTKSQ